VFACTVGCGQLIRLATFVTIYKPSKDSVNTKKSL